MLPSAQVKPKTILPIKLCTFPICMFLIRKVTPLEIIKDKFSFA